MVLEKFEETMCITGLEHTAWIDLLCKRIERTRTYAEVINIEH